MNRDKKGKFKRGHKVNLGKKNALGTHHKLTEKVKKKMSKSKKGNKNPNWKGGVHKSKRSITKEYKEWRFKVFQRDSFTCIKCQKVGGELHAHHIKGWKKYPKLRFDIDNGITFCRECHYRFHFKNYG